MFKKFKKSAKTVVPEPAPVVQVADLPAAFQEGAGFLLLPASTRSQVRAYKVRVQSQESRGAWFESLEPEAALPSQSQLLAVCFENRERVTFHCRVLERKGGRLLLSPPSRTEREKSQLPVYTGRQEYRVEIYFPGEVWTQDGDTAGPIQFCHLVDLSQGGMGIEIAPDQSFAPGQRIMVRLVSWDYPVQLESQVVRCWDVEGARRLALLFPDEISEVNKELISTFILDVQRKQARGLKVDR